MTTPFPSANTDTSGAAAYGPTAQKILHTAARLFMQLGYRAVSINDIVQAAGVTKPTLYYYFPDKAELFTRMALQRLEAMHEAIAASIAGVAGLPAQLAAIAGVLLNADDGDIRMLRHEMAEHLDPAHQQRLQRAFYQHLFAPIQAVMQQGLDQGGLAQRPAAELAMLFLSVMEAFHGFTHQFERMPPQLGALRLQAFAPAALVDLFLHGVAREG